MKKVSGLCLGKEHFRAGEWEAMCGGTRRYGLEARSRGPHHSSDTDDPGKPGQAASATGFHDRSFLLHQKKKKNQSILGN